MFHILKTHTEHISMCQKLFPDLDTRERSNPELSAGNYLSISPENIRLTFKMHDFGTRNFVCLFHILKTHTEHISMCQKLFPDLDTRERSNPELSAGNYLSISPENIRLTFKMHDFGTRNFVITIYFYVITHPRNDVHNK